MMKKINSIGIFCGSKSGKQDIYAKATKQLTNALCNHGITIVYGGSNMGLMQVIEQEALAQNAEIIGVMPERLVRIEQASKNLKDLRIVKDMAERKAMMADLSDAFLMLPGGMGSLDEFFEMLVQTHLGYQHKPVALLNIHGYYDKLIEFIKHMGDEGFIYADYHDHLMIADDIPSLLHQFSIS